MNMASNSSFRLLAIIMGLLCAFPETSAVVYITPNAASCGEVENCTSLTEYAKIPRSESTNLIFLPGNHVLDGTLFFHEAPDVTLLGDCSSSKTCPLITCSSSDLLFANVTRTVITNLRFANCLLTMAPNVTSSLYRAIPRDLLISSQITNCSFTHTSNSVLIISANVANIEHCSFTNILTDTNLAIVVFTNSVTDFKGNNTFKNNVYSAINIGTSLFLYSTNATFSDNTLFYNNSGRLGGSLVAYNSNLAFKGNTVFHLSISRFAGALVSYRSTISFYGETLFEQNFADNIGAMAAELSRLNVFGNLTFYNNRATNAGGGLGLGHNSQIYLAQGSKITFELNHAGLGGAIFIEDRKSCYLTVTPCFFQPMDVNSPVTDLIFINNSANVAGGDIYGGDIDECTINNQLFLSTTVFDSIATFHQNKPTTSSIASDAIQVCECVDDAPVCQSRSQIFQCILNNPALCTINRTIFSGENIFITVAAVGQRGGIVPGEIRALTNIAELDTGLQIPFSDSEVIRGINATCTTLSYTVTSTSPVEIFSLYPRASVCRSAYTPLPIALWYKKPCPYGFQAKANISNGACVCEERLRKVGFVSCNITRKSFQHRGEYWIGFDNRSKELIIRVGRCPFDYCVTEQEVSFTLENTQKQCSFNRSGLLCGACQNGLSVLLGGTSRCESCSSAYLALLIPFAIAGIALVVLLFVCELTVAAGTLSGLIFYANVVQINRALFFKSKNILTIFMAWLNLDLGIETCFYNGLDTYGKTWLQFLFPFYIWTIVGLIILLSRYSMKVTKLLGSHPVAVLATLFLLSYVKILRVLISAVLFTTLDYFDQKAVVWKLDANIEYIQKKHIPLFLASVLVFILLFIPYTVLLLFGQWFQAKSHWKCMSWAKSQRLKAFLDVYQAPYKDQHRYWPGLLLLFRIALAITNATAAEFLTPVSYAVMVTVLLVQLWGWMARGVYKKWPLDLLEAVFFVNLGLLMFATYHIENLGGNQEAATNTSVSITLLVFVGILLYHILVLRLKVDKISAKSCIMKLKNRKKAQPSGQGEATVSPPNVSTNAGPVPVFVSFFSLREVLLEDEPN